MPPNPLKSCSQPGCGKLVRDASRCPRHTKQRRQQYDRQRGSAAARGYGYQWQKQSKAYLRAQPLCRHCEAKGLTVRATQVDHKDPKAPDDPAFWDQTNWQPLCKPCHSAKTAREDGRWG